MLKLGCSARLVDRYLSMVVEYGDETACYPERVNDVTFSIKNKEGLTLRTLKVVGNYENSDGQFKAGMILFFEEAPVEVYALADTTDGIVTGKAQITKTPDTITQGLY
jgi:hypothetical protein